MAGAGGGQPGRMRRFQALHRSFPFLTRFRFYRVSADPRPGQTPRRLSAGAAGRGPAVPGWLRSCAKGQRLLSPRMPPCAPTRPRAQLLAAPAVFLARC